MEKGWTFEAVDENGNTIECKIIMSYICDANNHAYVFYTDNTFDEDGGIKLQDIVDEEEWKLLDNALIEAKKWLEA